MHIVLVDNGRTRHARRPADPRGAALHPLRRLRQRLPALRGGRRARLRLHLFGGHRPGQHAVPPRPRGGGRAAEPLRLLQRLRHGLPGRDPAAAADPGRAGPGGRGAGPARADPGGAGAVGAARPGRPGAARRRAGRHARCARAASPACRAWALDLIPAGPPPDRLAHAARPAAPARPRPPAPARARSPPRSLPSAADGLRVAYFIQCITDRLFPGMAQAIVRVLEACGVAGDRARRSSTAAACPRSTRATCRTRRVHGPPDDRDAGERAGRLYPDRRRQLRRRHAARLRAAVRRRAGLAGAGRSPGRASRSTSPPSWTGGAAGPRRAGPARRCRPSR